MTKRKSALILLASLIMICLCISAVSAANTTDNTTLSNTNTTNAISVDNNQANTINLEQNNKTVDKSINTNQVSTIDLNQKTENNLKTVETVSTNDTVYISNGNYTFENNTFINSPQTEYNSNNNYNVTLNSNLNSLLSRNLLSSSAVNTTPLSISKNSLPSVYVNCSRTYSGDGASWENATNDFWNSFYYVIKKGGVIYLADGLYNINQIVSISKNFTIVGQSRENTIFYSTDQVNFMGSYTDNPNTVPAPITFINLTINNSLVLSENFNNFINITFNNSPIVIGVSEYHRIDSRDGTPSYDTTFTNCIFSNYVTNTTMDYNGYGIPQDTVISSYPYHATSLYDCTFCNITTGSLVYTDSSDALHNVNLSNCVFDNCNVTGIGAYDQNVQDLVVVDNCWIGSNNVSNNVVNNGTHNYVNCTGSHVVANLTNSTPIVYNNPTTFNVVFSSLNEDGTVNTGANFTGFPSVPVNYTINGENILGNIVDGVSEVNYTLVNDKTPVTAIVNNQSLSLALPKMISESEINITVPSTGTTGTVFTVTSNVTSGATGNVTYYVNGVAVSTLSVGKAFTYTPSKAGTYNVSATYNGDDTYASSSTGNSSIVVSDPYIPPTPVPTPSSTSLVNSFINNTLTITLTSGNTGLNGKTVTVTVKGENTTTYKLTTGTNGKAVLDLNNLTSGTYTVSDNFVGNSAYASSSTTSTINITHPVVNNNVTVTVANITGDAGANTTVNVNLTYVNGTNVNAGNVTVNVNGKNYTSTVVNGTSSIPITLPTNSGNVTVTYTNGNYSTSVNVPVTVKTVSNVTVLTADNLTETFGQGQNFTGYLKDIYGNPIIGQHIAINLTRLSNGLSKVYWVTTDTNGAYQLQINLGLGAYSAKVSYAGKGNYTASPDANASIIVNSADTNKTITTLTADKFNHKFGAGENFTGKLINPSTNQPIIGQHIAINLTRLSNGLSKVYWVTTDTNGEYQLAINLGLGNYTAACSYAGTSAYQASNASNTITVTA